MQIFVERARQALGLGPDAFLASTLEAQGQTLRELDVFAPNLRDMVKAARAFADDTNKFLESTAKYITEAPFPRPWMQGSGSEAAQVAQLPVPAEHAAWFDAGIAEREAGVVPGAVGYAFSRELLAPMEQWLWAHQVAQGYLSELQSKRLTYDAERRKLVQRATDATAAAAHPTGGTLDPALAQLTEEAAAISVTLHEFESDVEALDDLLAWLAEGAVRLKALLADTAGSVGVAADTWAIPPGIMPPFPEKSSFGQNLEVTVSVSDAPLGLGKSEEVVAGPTGSTLTASEAGGVTTITSLSPHTKSHEGASHSGSAGDARPQLQPDLGQMLPSDDALVYGGGVAPPEPEAAPSGGGPAQLLKDTLAGSPRTAAPDQDQGRKGRDQDQHKEKSAAAQPPYTPDLSEVLPSDEALIYGGGMAPPADIPEPSGGGVGQLVKESATGRVTPVGDEEQAQHPEQDKAGRQQAAAETPPNPDLSAMLPADDAKVYGGGVAPSPDTGRAEPSGGGPGQLVQDTVLPPTGDAHSSSSSAPTITNPAAPEVAARSPHSYRAEGTGRVEARAPAAAAGGLGAAQRRMGRAWSADTPASAVRDQGAIKAESSAGKELAIVPSSSDASQPAASPAAPTATSPPAPTATTTATAEGGSGADPAGAAGSAGESSTRQGADHTDSSIAQPGGIWSAIQRTVAGAGAAAAAAATAVAHAVPGVGQGVHDAVEEAVEAAQQEEGEGGAEGDVQAVVEEFHDAQGGDAGPPSGSGVTAAAQPSPPATGSSSSSPADDYVVATTVSGADTEDAGLTPPVGLAEPAPASPAPDQPEMPASMPTAAYPPVAGTTAENIRATSQRVRDSLAMFSEAAGGSSKTGAQAPPHQGPVALPESLVGDPTATKGAPEQGSMHIGPVTPPEGPAEPAPGSAEWVKEGVQPGGAAAGGVEEVKDTAAAQEPGQGKMHIGPVAPPQGPAEPAPGSAVWMKEGVRPGGAAAAPAGSSDDDDARQGKDISSSKQGPDLSNMLPGDGKGIPGVLQQA